MYAFARSGIEERSRDECEETPPLSRRPKLQRLHPDQVQALRVAVEESTHLTQERSTYLMHKANLSRRQIEVWFQNERARIRTKKAQHDFNALKELHQNSLKAIAELQRVNAELKDLLQRTYHQCGSADAFLQSDESHLSNMLLIGPGGDFSKGSIVLSTLLGYREAEHLRLNIFNITYGEDESTTMIDQVLTGRVLAVVMRLRFRSRIGTDVWAVLKAYSLCLSTGEAMLVGFVNPL
mmetsp:Transcript_4082/g.6319  ORF Transcript_4082/g.6319 Transcript_4082/m.6319 type:complete len:238 (-) Transcript_4082:574-1287(-)